MSVNRNIFIVDDDAAVCHAVSTFLTLHKYQVRTYNSARMLLEDIDESTEGILLLDLCIPGLSGLELQAELANRGIVLPTIFITGHGEIKLSVMAMKAGAIDFLEKPISNEHLLNSISEAFKEADNKLTRDKMAAKIRIRHATLTNREKEVMHHLIAGRHNKDIAKLLGISRRTVEVHRFSVMKKMKASSLPHLVRQSNFCTEFSCNYYSKSDTNIYSRSPVPCKYEYSRTFVGSSLLTKGGMI